MHVGKRISKIRKARNLSREELGGDLICARKLHDLESGRLHPEKLLLQSLAERLDLPADYLEHYYIDDKHLEAKLAAVHALLDAMKIQCAGGVIRDLEHDYPYVPSLKRELQMLLLKTYYYVKAGDVTKGVACYEKEIHPLVGVDENINDHELKELYYYVRGEVYFHQENYSMSFDSYLTQLKYAQANITKARASYNAAISAFELHDIQTARKYCDMAIFIYLKEQDWKRAADAYNMIGILCWEVNELEKSEDYLRKALHLDQEFAEVNLKEQIYHNLGLVYQKRNDVEKSLVYLSESLRLKKQSRSKGISITYYHLLNT
jgi:HTH-type transcriptional regulator, quorum sensing regulator NprR